MPLDRSDIPADFPVRPLAPHQRATERMTCGACGLSWDDGIATQYTPAPGARCPFEAFHESDDDESNDDESNDDDGRRYVPNRPRTNEDLVRDLLNYSPTGALCQAFIIEAISRYAKQCADADPATFDSGLMNGRAWVACAKHIREKMEAFYAPKPR